MPRNRWPTQKELNGSFIDYFVSVDVDIVIYTVEDFMVYEKNMSQFFSILEKNNKIQIQPYFIH